MKKRVTWSVLGALLLVFVAVPATLTHNNHDGISVQIGEIVLWLMFAAPSFFAAWLLINRWWNRSGEHLSTMDGPARLLAIAVASMPESRKDWAAAMKAELTQVPGLSPRWWFALDASRAALFPPRGSRLPAVATAVAVVVLVAAVFQTVGREMPVLRLFAVTFVLVAGVLTLLAVTRGRRIAPSPAATATIILAVAGCIATTVYTFLKYPITAEGFGPGQATALAAILAGCLWLALGTPRSLATSRRARWIGVGAGFLMGGLQLLTHGGHQLLTAFPPESDAAEALGLGLLFLYLVFGLGSVLFIGARYVAGKERSLRSGVQTAVWGATVGMLVNFTIWMVVAMEKHPPGSPVANVMAGDLSEAIFWSLIWIAVWALPFGILGAASGSAKIRDRAGLNPVTPARS